MAFQVIDGKQRYLQRVGQGLAVGDADQQGADESGAPGHCDRAQLARSNPSTGQGLPHDLVDGLDVAPAGQFGPTPPERALGLTLRPPNLASPGPLAPGTGGAGFDTVCPN